MGVYSLLVTVSAVAASVVYGASICTEDTSISPSLYPPGAPACPEFDTIMSPEYSINPVCSDIYNKLTCNFQSVAMAMVGQAFTPDWTEEEITDLCGTCLIFTKYLATELAEEDTLGCNFLAEYVEDLCYFHVKPGSSTPTNCYADDEGAIFTDIAYYLGGLQAPLETRCGELSVCDREHFEALTAFFGTTASLVEGALSVAFPTLDLVTAEITDFCDVVLNQTDGAMFMTGEVTIGSTWVANSVDFPFIWFPFVVTDTLPEEDTTACDASTAKEPDSDSTTNSDATCPSWNSLVKTGGISSECTTLINNIRCNMDDLTGGSSDFFLASEINNLCTGACAGFTKYVINQLEDAPEDEPGCEFIKVFLEGTCTKYDALDGSSDLCTERGSAFLTAIRASFDPTKAVEGQNRFVSACSAYSCCEDAAFKVLPYYFEISDSITELGLETSFPISLGEKNITAISLCAESGASAVLASNGDVCSSTLTSVTAAEPSSGGGDAAASVVLSSALLALIIAVAIFFV